MTLELNKAPPVQPRLVRHIAARKLTGQKPALKMKEVWAIRIRLQLARKTRELALFNMAIDSKLRGCDLIRLMVEDMAAAGEVKTRAVIVQKKTGRPGVQFEITEQTRASVTALIQTHTVRTRLPIPQPACLFAVLISPPVRAPRSGLGQIHRAHPGQLRHPFASPHKSGADLSKDWKSPRRAALARSHQARKHRSVPGS